MKAVLFLSMLPVGFLGPTPPVDDAPNSDWHHYADEEYRAGVALRQDRELAQKHFRRATEAYETLWQRGEQSVVVTRNLGQAYFLADDLGRSIHAYRRGLARYPTNTDLLRDLQTVRTAVLSTRSGDLADMIRPHDPVLLMPNQNRGLLFLGFLLLTIVGWALLFRAWLAGGWGRWLAGVVVVLVSVIVAGTVWREEQQAARYWSQPTAVVVRSGADFRSGNSDEYPRKIDGSLPAGTELLIIGERGGWLQVELPNGTVGWVSSRQVVEFRPDHAQ